MVNRLNDFGIRQSQIHKQNLDNKKSKKATKNFADVLKDSFKKEELRFSSHAISRMNERGIQLDESRMQRLEEAVEKADEKGAKECLVMLDNDAFVVSVKNRTIITAVDENSMRGNVFTNIDSAVFGV